MFLKVTEESFSCSKVRVGHSLNFNDSDSDSLFQRLFQAILDSDSLKGQGKPFFFFLHILNELANHMLSYLMK